MWGRMALAALIGAVLGGGGLALAQIAMPEEVARGWAERPIRTTLATVPLAEPKRVTRVEMMRVDYPAGQVQARHVHPVPLACFVAIGRIGLKLAGEAEMAFDEGSVNVEPAGQVVERVANLTDRPARQYCVFLAGEKDRVLSRDL